MEKSMEKEVATRAAVPQKSMFQAARDKKRARRYHSRNFTLGYVKADNHYLSRAGLRGRKRWLLVALIVSVYCVVIGQLLITSVILGILRFKTGGSEYLRFESDGSAVLPRGADIAYAQVLGPVLGYFNESLTLSSHGYPVVLEAGNQRNVPTGDHVLNSSQAYFDAGTVRFAPFSNFSVGTAGERGLLFVNSSLVMLQAAAVKLKNMTATEAVTKEVVSAQIDLAVSSPLISVSSVLGASLQGSQVTVASKTIGVKGQVAINLDGRKGVGVRSLPTSTSGGGSAAPQSAGSGYRLCACSNGMLFLVPATSMGCRANEIKNPCDKA
eukprot:Em0022g526a